MDEETRIGWSFEDRFAVTNAVWIKSGSRKAGEQHRTDERMEDDGPIGGNRAVAVSCRAEVSSEVGEGRESEMETADGKKENKITPVGQSAETRKLGHRRHGEHAMTGLSATARISNQTAPKTPGKQGGGARLGWGSMSSARRLHEQWARLEPFRTQTPNYNMHHVTPTHAQFTVARYRASMVLPSQ